jgi:hypothetical protein
MPLGLCMLVSITARTSENTFSQTSEYSVKQKFYSAEGTFCAASDIRYALRLLPADEGALED